MKKAVMFTFAIGLISNVAFAGGAGTGQPLTEIDCPATANHARYDSRFSESSGWWYTTGISAPGALTVNGQKIECFQVWETF